MFSNTEFNHLKLKLDQLYLSLSGGKVNGETVFSKKVTFGTGNKTIKIHDGIIEGLDSPEGHIYDLEPSSDKSELLFTEDGTLKDTLPVNTNYVGTRARWNTLTAAEKAKYLTMDFTDDESRYYREPTTGNETPIAINQTRTDIIDIAESSDVDTADNTTTFTSSDTTDANANAWTSVTKLSSGEDHKSIFAKMSQMFKNVRYLYKTLANKQDKLSTSSPSYTVNNTVVQNVRSIKRYGNIVAVSLILKFQGLSTNTYYNCITGLPAVRTNFAASFPNEYGSDGTCTVDYYGSTVSAKCSHANSYYYVEIIGIVG